MDQAVSSFGSLALPVFVARNVSSDDFGAFGIALGIAMLFLGINRALVCEPWLIGLGDQRDIRELPDARAAVAASTCNAVAFGLVSVAAGALTEDAMRIAFFSISVALPGILVQDLCRYACFSARRYRTAAALDATWTVLLIIAMVFLETRGASSIATCTLLWGLGAYVSALIGLLRIALPVAACFSWVSGFRFLRGKGSHGGPLALEWVTTLGTYNLGLVSIAALASATAVAALRGAQLVFAPLQTLWLAGAAFLLPRWVADVPSGGDERSRRGYRAALVLGVFAAVWGLFVQFIPATIGEALLGASWGATKAVLILYAPLTIINALQTGLKYSLRAAAAADLLLRISLVQAPFTLVFIAIGAGVAGASGAVAGLVASHMVGLVLTHVQVMRLPATRTTGDGRLSAARSAV